MKLIIDSSALIAYLANEPGADVVDELLNDVCNDCCVHAVNLCEVYYDVLRRTDEATVKETVSRLTLAGLTTREDMDSDFWQDAGSFKANLIRISLADCFCVALTRRIDGELVTADHREMEPVAGQELCRVRFIR